VGREHGWVIKFDGIEFTADAARGRDNKLSRNVSARDAPFKETCAKSARLKNIVNSYRFRETPSSSCARTTMAGTTTTTTTTTTKTTATTTMATAVYKYSLEHLAFCMLPRPAIAEKSGYNARGWARLSLSLSLSLSRSLSLSLSRSRSFSLFARQRIYNAGLF